MHIITTYFANIVDLELLKSAVFRFLDFQNIVLTDSL